MFDKDSQNQPKPISEIVREMTDDGRHIVQFLLDMMQDKIAESEPHHRLDAIEQLLEAGSHQHLADFILEKTDDGRLIVRFLMDVMQSRIDDVTPRDREEARQFLYRIFNGESWIPFSDSPEQ